MPTPSEHAWLRSPGVSTSLRRDGAASWSADAPDWACASAEPRFSIANERKDVGLALDLARSLHLRLSHGEHLAQPFGAAIAAGLGDKDIAAMRLLGES